LPPGRPVLARAPRPRGLRRGDPDLPGRLAVAVPVVALPGGPGHVPDGDLRPPRGQAHFLGPAPRRAPRRVGQPARRPRPRVGEPRLPLGYPDPVRARARTRALAG